MCEQASAHCLTQQVGAKNLHILFATPRVLLVAVRAGALCCDALVIHAPDSGSDEPVELWWQQLRALLTRLCGQHPTVVMADVSGHFGSVTSEAVGPVGAETKDLPGKLCRELLQDLQLMVPATFPERANQYPRRHGGHRMGGR